jgi:hypothetical protein
MLLWTATLACGPVEDAPGKEEPASHTQEVQSFNSETLNGLAFNGQRGDGTCQFTESCGIGMSTVQCTPDCGLGV